MLGNKSSSTTSSSTEAISRYLKYNGDPRLAEFAGQSTFTIYLVLVDETGYEVKYESSPLIYTDESLLNLNPAITQEMPEVI